MRQRIPIKNHHLEIQLIARRSMLALFGCVFITSLLIWRLAYLQIYKHDLYTTLATKNWLDLVPIEPTRGLIYDRNGVILAENVPVFSLDLVPYHAKNLDQNLLGLKKIIQFDDNDIQQVKKLLRQHRHFDDVPLKLRLTEEEVARFTENQYQFPGFFIKARLMRRYPFGKNFSHVLGYVGRINAQELNHIDLVNYSASHYIGKLGIEKSYETKLHGTVGYQEVENDASGKPIRVLKETPAIPGENIYLTIDSKLQLATEKALAGHRGAVVALQPSTGQVLALVSEPSYDPNAFVQGISQNEFKNLQRADDKPLYNRALRGLYPPASTIKPFIALEGLDTQTITADEKIWDEGWFQIVNTNHKFHDYLQRGHGYVDVLRAIAVSCDVFFYQLANKMGIKNIAEMLSAFGFGRASGLDIPDELPGVVASPEWKQRIKGKNWYGGDTINAGIGQGYMQVTPIQLATATATLANHGIHYQPYLLLAEQMPNATFIMKNPNAKGRIILNNTRYWDIIINAMQAVVENPQGTASHTYGPHPNYSLAAKTGTAQVSSRRNPEQQDKQELLPEKLRDHHLFIAFAPVNKPTLALAVITENSNTAIDVARQIFDFYLRNASHVDRLAQTKIQKTNA